MASWLCGDAEDGVGGSVHLLPFPEKCKVGFGSRIFQTRKFDYAEAGRRVGRDGDDKAINDDGRLLKDEAETFAPLEVGHIIPHSLMNVSGGTELVCSQTYVYFRPPPPGRMDYSQHFPSQLTGQNDSKQTALTIFNMFDDGIVHLIEGSDIDRPRNTFSLTYNLHQLFGNFEIFFEPTT